MHYRIRSTALAALIMGAAACGGDKEKGTEAKAAPPPVSPDDYRKKQQAYAESVFTATGSARDVATKLGKGVDVGSIRMRDTVATLAVKSDCLSQGRQADPYLAGTVTFKLFMSVAGSTSIVVLRDESKWTSQAGNVVNACLDLAAKNWKLNESFGKQGDYVTQIQFKSDAPPPAEKK